MQILSHPHPSPECHVCYLQFMSLHGCCIITQSPEFTVHSPCCIYCGFRQIIMTKIHQYSIIQSTFTALKSFVFLLFIPSSIPWQPLIFQNLFFFFFLRRNCTCHQNRGDRNKELQLFSVLQVPSEYSEETMHSRPDYLCLSFLI